MSSAVQMLFAGTRPHLHWLFVMQKTYMQD